MPAKESENQNATRGHDRLYDERHIGRHVGNCERAKCARTDHVLIGKHLTRKRYALQVSSQAFMRWVIRTEISN